MHVRTFLQSAIDITRPLMPHRLCRLCQGLCRGQALCDDCQRQMQDAQHRCPRCALPLQTSPPQSNNKNITLCGECVSQPPAFSASITAGCYRPPLNHWLNNFKERRELRDGKLLCQLLLPQLQQHYEDNDWPEFLVPVPLHWQRLLIRGFNQSLWIARELQRATAIPILTPLSRHRGRHAQKQLSKTARRANLGRAFVVKTNQISDIHNRHLALIDDVMTTTATARVISERLLQTGARQIDVWTLARTDKTGFQH